MEKLVNLLNEFREEFGYKGGIIYGGFGARHGDLNFIFQTSKFPFIKRLIDTSKVDLNGYPQIGDYSDDESLLMYLSIQNNPIDFLISILK